LALLAYGPQLGGFNYSFVYLKFNTDLYFVEFLPNAIVSVDLDFDNCMLDQSALCQYWSGTELDQSGLMSVTSSAWWVIYGLLSLCIFIDYYLLMISVRQ
jgi:hypothetical protein